MRIQTTPPDILVEVLAAFNAHDEVRMGLGARFEGIPDVHYGDDSHFPCGDRRAAEWTLTGTTAARER
jgi:hypothetical protein